MSKAIKRNPRTQHQIPGRRIMQHFTPIKFINARENQPQKKGGEKGKFHSASAQGANEEEESKDGPGHQKSAHIGIGNLGEEKKPKGRKGKEINE